MKKLIYEKLELQPYLIEPLFNEESRNLLLRLRTRTVNGIKADFKGIYREISCSLGCDEKDTLENILKCKVLISHYKTKQLSHGPIMYEDIFSRNITKQKETTELFRESIELRNEIISQPVAGLVPCIVLH